MIIYPTPFYSTLQHKLNLYSDYIDYQYKCNLKVPPYQITIQIPINRIYSIWDGEIRIFEMQIPSKVNGYYIKIEKRNL